ncbi:DNA polymerase iota, partial [Nestor notabilis]
SARSRVIVHLDLDCFYAQVEMIRAPDLRDKPLGVQQKALVVTCNYEAREHGVKKLMALKEAKEKCPHLVLVNGEDLTPYREMSYKVTELLGQYCPLVERLGFDENFLDITEVVEERLKHLQQRGWAGVHVAGHVYKDQALNLHDTTHLRLVLGSQVAEDLREALNSKLGLTSCAGVASNKLLAKLVSGTFKPNQQTLLLPESSQELLRSLGHIQKVPGIGYKTTKRLETLGVKTVVDLQRFPSAVLEKELGVALAQRIQKLSYGEDEAPVTPSGPPQSFSDEDSFKKCSSEVEVQEKLEELLPSLLDRIHKDGRQPRTIRLTIRRFSSAERWFHRECRQCPIPPHLIPKFGKDTRSIISPLVTILMKLFRKMVNVKLPFHLTLLNICFSNLQELPTTKKGSIGFYLKSVVPPPAPEEQVRWGRWDGAEGEGLGGEGSAACGQSFRRSDGIPDTRKLSEGKENSGRKGGIPDFPAPSFPGAIDQEVFRELPEDIQQELLAAQA